MSLFSSRQISVSAKNARRGRAFWQCPYCRKGKTGMRTTNQAVEAAHEHMREQHPGVIDIRFQYAR